MVLSRANSWGRRADLPPLQWSVPPHTGEQPKTPAEDAWEPLNERVVSGNEKLFANVMCESCWQTETSSQWVCVSVAWTVVHGADKAGINANFFCVNVILLWCAKMTTSDVFTRNRRGVVREDFLLQMGKLSHFQIPSFSKVKMMGLGAGLVVLQHGNLHPESRWKILLSKWKSPAQIFNSWVLL